MGWLPPRENRKPPSSDVLEGASGVGPEARKREQVTKVKVFYVTCLEYLRVFVRFEWSIVRERVLH